MELYLARHGQSVHNRDKNDPGPHSPLTDKGREQAHRLGEWLTANASIDVIYTSPWVRARETADIVSDRLGLPVRVRDGLREAPVFLPDVLPQQPASWCDPWPVPSLEPVYTAFREQVANVMRDIVTQHPNEAVLVVAHGGTLATMIRLLLGVDAISFWTENAALHHLVWDGQRWDIRYVNRREHLGPDLPRVL